MSTAPTLRVEHEAFETGATLVAGMDEVGRGAWAGPVSVGVVLVDASCGEQPSRVRDSKAIARSVREALIPALQAWALETAVGHASHTECDLLGMRAAIALASSRALAALTAAPDVVICDGPLDLLEANSMLLADLVRDHQWRQRPPKVISVVKGDQHCASVAAASIVAKVTRDAIMADLGPSFPAFDFESNVGYPSQVHQRALRGYGLTPYHRRSWSYVDDLVWR